MAAIKVLLLISSVFPSRSEKCSLFYMYSAISKSLTSRDIYEFYNSVKLSDIQMSFCNSVNKADFLTQLCEESERLFRNESDELNYKQQWLQINLNTLMRHMRNENKTSDTDLHVLQWRHGCSVECHSNGSVIFLQGTDEYAYDGETLPFNLSMLWKPLVLEHDIIWNRESVSNLERKCVETLTSFTDLQRERKFITASRPEVYSSVKVSGSSKQQVLVCLATGFYPKHVQMEIRHDQKALPDEQLNSSGIRPNADGSFQLKKSLKILLSDRSHYQCVVKHQTLTEPLIIGWDEVNVLLPVITGSVVALVVLAIIVFCLLRKCVKYQKSLKAVRGSAQPYRCDFCTSINTYLPHIHAYSSQPYRCDFCTSINTYLPHIHAYSCMPSYCTQQIKPDILEEIRPETCAGLTAALNAASDDENATDDSMEEVQPEELHETQSLCEAKETPAAAPPAAARGTMGSKNISLPTFAMEREDTDQNTATQNALRLLLPLPRRCRSKNISMPNLTLERKDSDDSS